MKRGQSNILAVILVVLIVIVAVAIVFNIVNPILKKSSENIEMQNERLLLPSLETGKLQIGTNSADVVVSAGSGKGEITRARFVFKTSGENCNVEQNINIAAYETKSVNVPTAGCRDVFGVLSIEPVAWETGGTGTEGNNTATIPISSCQTLNASGVYILTANISTNTTCFNVSANNVTIDFNGHSVTCTNIYDAGFYRYGVNITANRTTVKNGYIYGEFGGGIISTGYNGNFTNMTIKPSLHNLAGVFGIYLRKNNNQVTNNIVNIYALEGNTYGIYLTGSSNNTISNNLVSNNTAFFTDAYGIYLTSNSNNNQIINNTANSNYALGVGISGIYLNSSSNNNLTGNTANSNFVGIYLTSSSNNTLTNNNLWNCTAITTYGCLYLASSNNNTISGGLINLSTANLISLVTNSNNNVFSCLTLLGATGNYTLIKNSVNNTFSNIRYNLSSSCAGKQCGDDGCGVSCGTCGSGQNCSNGQCVFSNSTTRDKYKQPFNSTSIWNMPIGSNAVYVPANIPAHTYTGFDEDIIVLTPNAPQRQVWENNVGWTQGNRCTLTTYSGFNVPIPDNFVIGDERPSTPNYAGAFLLNDNRTIVQFQPVARCNAGGNVTYTSGAHYDNVDIFGTGIPGAHGGSGLSSIGGTVRVGELVNGSAPMKHALKVVLWGKLALSCSGSCYRWPAQWADSCTPSCYTGNVPALKIGALLALKPSFNISSLQTEPAKKIAWTLQNYGAYVVDDSAWSSYYFASEKGPAGDVFTEFADSWGFTPTGILTSSWNRDWNQGPVSNTATAWGKDMNKIFTNLNVVDNNAANNIGGGGTPLQPLAPPLQ